MVWDHLSSDQWRSIWRDLVVCDSFVAQGVFDEGSLGAQGKDPKDETRSTKATKATKVKVETTKVKAGTRSRKEPRESVVEPRSTSSLRHWESIPQCTAPLRTVVFSAASALGDSLHCCETREIRLLAALRVCVFLEYVWITFGFNLYAKNFCWFLV